MLANFTETLEDLLTNKGYGTGSQDQSLTDIISLMNKFPHFIFEIEQDNTIDLSMLNMFIDKYDIREIGAETEELFLHYWKEKTNVLLIKYAPKMKMWLDNFNDLFKFTVQLTIQDNSEYSNSSENSGSNKNTYYLNPVSKTTTNLKVNDVDESENSDTRENSGSRERTITRDALQTVWGKTRADILEKILNVKDVFNDCLEEFETIFMGVL